MAADHLTIRIIDEGQLLVCGHCGAAQIVRLPMPIAEWLVISRRFKKQHRHCQPQGAAPSETGPLPHVEIETA